MKVSATRRLGQVVTGLAALIVLVGLLFGGPIALLAFAGNPLPETVPTLAEVGDALTSRDSGQLFLNALAVVGWLGWATFALSVLLELPARAFRRSAPRLPGMKRQQKLAASLIGATALILVASPATAAVASATTTASTLAGPIAASPNAVLTYPGPIRLAAPEAEPRYRVERGDYLGAIAAAEGFIAKLDEPGVTATVTAADGATEVEVVVTITYDTVMLDLFGFADTYQATGEATVELHTTTEFIEEDS